MESASDALIMVFARDLVPGEVKTRIAKERGEAFALSLYRKLCLHTSNVVCQVDCDHMVCLDRIPSYPVIWPTDRFKVSIQQGADLGQRMAHAFQERFNDGYRRVVVIGSDCPGISSEILNEAISVLDDCRAVIGPAVDGGYYLLGLSAMHDSLFTGIQWGSSSVLGDTIRILEQLGLDYRLLPELHDIDRPADLERLGEWGP